MADLDILNKVYNRDKATPSGPHEKRSSDARCHCRRFQFIITLPASSLPLNGMISTAATAAIRAAPLGTLKRFCLLACSPNGRMARSKTSWLAIKSPAATESAHFVLIARVMSGTWIRPVSSVGGRAVNWLPKLAGREVLHLSPGDRDAPEKCEPVVGPDGEERLRAECCCGGVSFTISRSSQETINDEYMGQYVSPTDPRKRKAFLDMCRDCGRLSGTSVSPWLLVPRIVLGPEVPPDLKIGTIRTYSSSKRNTRGFCGVCGATVFLRTTLRTPTERQAVLNVGMGILRAPEGMRAENWVSWRTANIAWANDARSYDADLTEALVTGHRHWGVETTGEALDFPVI
ncbi:putative Mss4-like protein [Seiridium unicorne]|uniref:Mss4-like protein n=1 Tax=Seiridium unicorne TaxID=138068 RepID=A0ABR2UEW4_9PEZI